MTWIMALTIGAFGWTCCAWLLWQQKQSQESWATLQRQFEDQDARHAELSRHVAELESEIDEPVTAQGELTAIEERRQQASEQLLAIESKRKSAEAATAALALRHEVIKSRYAASEVPALGKRRLRLLSQAPATDARRKIPQGFVSGAGHTCIPRRTLRIRQARGL